MNELNAFIPLAQIAFDFGRTGSVKICEIQGCLVKPQWLALV